jgi:ribonucleoside-diphosphate reductase alpha chain
MQAAIDQKDWWTRAVTQNGKKLEKKEAADLLNKIAEGTHTCGDPGIQYDGAIQKWHTCKGTEPIHSTNPCSEYVFLNNTACNLASLNLMKFKEEDGKFNHDRFKAAVRVFKKSSLIKPATQRLRLPRIPIFSEHLDWALQI